MYLRTVRSQNTTLDPKVEQVFVSSNGIPLTSPQVSTSVYRTCQREGIATKGRMCATIVRKSLATEMHTCMPDEQEHLAALAQHMTRTQADYYRVHEIVSETDLRLTRKKRSLPHVQRRKRKNFNNYSKKTLQLGLYEGELNEKVSTTNLLKVHSFKAIVLKLRRISAEQRKDISHPSEKMTSTEKVSSSLSSNRLEGGVFGPVNAFSLQSDSSRFWRKITDEQTSYVLSLTKDLVENDSVKREIVWEWVRNDSRSQELGLITGKEDQEELMKCKQTNSYSAQMRKTVTTQREKNKNKICMLI